VGGAKLDAVGIVVSDLARSVSFYRELGVPFEAGAEQSEHGHAEANLQGGVRLLIDTEAGMKVFDPAWKRASGGAPSASLAFHCDSPTQVDQLYARGLALGGHSHKEPWDAFWGQRYAQLRDPDGNGVDLYAELEPGS
jgi:catechol 2,3-dioxygenase-like lactoylglutathione lyase family enzyme